MELKMERKPYNNNFPIGIAEGKLTGFTPQPTDWMAKYRKSTTAASLELSRIMRTAVNETASGLPTLEYKLWLEAGKYYPPSVSRPDDNYNTNIWRNFCQNYGIQSKPEDKPENSNSLIDETITAIYPLNVPKPSSMNEKTFANYIETNKQLFQDPFKRRLALKKIRESESVMKRMKIMSEMRNPPLDEKGYILPPEGYKKYKPLFLPPTHTEEDPPVLEITPDMEPDMFGQLIRKKPRANLWKLSYRTSNPLYRQAIQYAKDLKEGNVKTSMFPAVF